MNGRILLALLLLPLGVFGLPHGLRAAETDEGAPSPDGKLVFRHLEEESYGVVEVATGRRVALGKEATLEPMHGAIAAVWSKDSQRLAVNLKAGTRFDTTRLYRWAGEEFADFAMLESLLENRVDADRALELKRMKVPPEIYLRRIWDTYRTLRWVDARTVEVFVRSERYFLRKKEPEEGDSVVIETVYTVRFEKSGTPKIAARRKATAKELEP